MTKKLDGFVGSLSVSEIADGIAAARANAKRLYEDAKLLLEGGRYPSAAALAILAIEEAGKVPILRTLAVADDAKEVSNAWRSYRSHTRKNVTWIIRDLALQGARRLDDLAPIFDAGSDHPFVLDQLKQISLYTDCLGKKHWSRPDVAIDKAIAEELVLRAGTSCAGEEVTAQELELWVKHMKPVKNEPHARQKRALVNWYSELQAHGLAPAGVNIMEKFIFEGLDENGG